MKTDNELLRNADKLHTTDLGKIRIAKNLGWTTTDNAVEKCREMMENHDAKFLRRGKNWYISTGDLVITVNAGNFGIITAHKLGELSK